MDADACYTLARWTTIGETDPYADRNIDVKRVVTYVVHDTGGYKAPSDREFEDAETALRVAAEARADVDGRGRYQQWEPIDSAGRPVDGTGPG